MFDRSPTFLEKLIPWFFLAVVIFRFATAGTVGLGDDEAYYWHWSLTPQWSYFDHPGMTAWLIRLSTDVFGPTPFAVRFPALVFNLLSGIVLFLLANSMFELRTALWSLLFYLICPLYALGGMMAVPDAPMGFAWALVAFLGWKASVSLTDRTFVQVEERVSIGYWILIGVTIGFGLLSKLTMILCAFSLLLFFLSDRQLRRGLFGAGFVSAVLVALFVSLPVLIWNHQTGWPMFQYHLQDRQEFNPNLTRWMQFWISQIAFFSPVLFVANGLGLLKAFRQWRDLRWRYLFLLSAPTLALFGIQSLFSDFKPHWPAPGHFVLFIAAGQLFTEGFGARDDFAAERRRRLFLMATTAILLPLFVLIHVAPFSPVLPRLAQWVVPSANWDPKFDPTNDLYGWKELVDELESRRSQISDAQGRPPFLSTWRYQLVSQLAYASKEDVVKVGPGRDYYTFAQTPDFLSQFEGRDSFFIADNRFERDPNGESQFASCVEQEPFKYYRSGILARTFHIWSCRGYHPPPPPVGVGVTAAR